MNFVQGELKISISKMYINSEEKKETFKNIAESNLKKIK